MPKPNCTNCLNGEVQVSVPCPCCQGDKSGYLPAHEAYVQLPKILDLLKLVALGNTEYDILSRKATRLMNKTVWK